MESQSDHTNTPSPSQPSTFTGIIVTNDIGTSDIAAGHCILPNTRMVAGEAQLRCGKVDVCDSEQQFLSAAAAPQPTDLDTQFNDLAYTLMESLLNFFYEGSNLHR